MRGSHASALILAVTVTSVCVTARADITLEERMKVEGTGLMSVANLTGHSITTLASDRGRFETKIQMQSKLVNMLTGSNGATAEIVRLDAQTIYDLNLKKKEYSEVTFAQKRAALEKALQQSQKAQAQAAAASPVDESQCEWSEPKSEVKRTGETATIAGYDAQRVTIVATQTCKNKQTGTLCDVGLALDQWLAPSFEGAEDTRRFYEAYAEKMGYSAVLSKNVAQRAETLFGRYKGVWREVGREMRGLKGYPVRATFGLGIGGPQCQSSQSSESAGSAGSPASKEDSEKAAATAAGEVAGQQAAQDAGQSAYSGLAGQLGGKLAGSLFKKKKDSAAPTEAAAAAAPSLLPGGLIPMLTLTNELVSVNHNAAAAATFEVPAGFTKVEN